MNVLYLQLQSRFGDHTRLSSSKEIVLLSAEDMQIHVMFAPSTIAMCKAKLQIRPHYNNSKYTVSENVEKL